MATGLGGGLKNASLGRSFAAISISSRVGFPCMAEGCDANFIPVADTLPDIKAASALRRAHVLDTHGITMPVYVPPSKWQFSRATIHRWMEDGKRARREMDGILA